MPFPSNTIVQLRQFTDIRPIGQGAAGQVYAARDNTGRIVAVKEALPSAQDFQERRARLDQEARIQGALAHPNIITFFHKDEDPQTHEIYLICEYANGGSLADYLRTHGPLSEQQVIKVALDICAALEATLAQDIVHRDIKPGNILLITDNQNQIVAAKLGDFGVARDNKRRQTTVQPGVPHAHTWQYMAPEQADLSKPVDVRTDLYALGITLWELLTATDYKVELSRPGMQQTGTGPDLQAYNPRASVSIAQVIQRAVQDDPGQRYQTPYDLARDLRDIRDGRFSAPPTQRPSRSTSLVTSSLVQRFRSRYGVAILIALIVTSLFGSFMISRSLSQAGSPELTPMGNTTTPALAARITDLPSASTTSSTRTATMAPTTAVTTPVPASTSAVLAPITATSTSEPFQCTVRSALNLRNGPGTSYERIRQLSQETILIPAGFSSVGFPPGGSWLYVQVQEGGWQGWVSAEPNFIGCTKLVDFTHLPAVPIPPTPSPLPISTATMTPILITSTATPTHIPTATNTATPTHIPTATNTATPTSPPLPRRARVVVTFTKIFIGDNSEPDDKNGELWLELQVTNNPPRIWPSNGGPGAPASANFAIKDNTLYSIGDHGEEFELNLSEFDPLTILVKGGESDNEKSPCERDANRATAHDDMGRYEFSYRNASVWGNGVPNGKGRSERDNSNSCHTGWYDIYYTIDVTWL
jgi:serine/threonine protein kinase